VFREPLPEVPIHLTLCKYAARAKDGVSSIHALTQTNEIHATGVSPGRLDRGSSFLRFLLIGLDAAALTIAWGTAAVAMSSSGPPLMWATISVVALVVGSVVFFNAIGLYRSRVCAVRVLEYERLARGCLGVALVALAVAAIAGSTPRREIVIGSVLAFVLVSISRSGYRAWLNSRRRAGHHLRRVLLVGAGDESAGLVALLSEHPELGYRTAGVVGNDAEARRRGLGHLWCADLGYAREALIELGVSGAIVCASDLRASDLNFTVQQLLDARAHVQLSSGLHGVDVGRLRPSPLAHEPLFYVERVTLASWQLATKRAIDFVLAAIMLILTAPLLALAAVGIKFQDRGPVLFQQSRVGRNGKPFVLYKLRTMREGAEHETAHLIDLNVRDGPLVKIAHDPRATVFGRVLRATSIDELPQLWNVLNGTMSLVGPRPALPGEVVHFDAELRARESVLPGLTGLWQVEGRDNPSFAAYRRFDLFYIQNWSVTLDLIILLGTVESVITRVFRALLHHGEEIALAPPEVRDPGAPVRGRRDTVASQRIEP
jgi:exopolysaccharide biosynthesis polyprenyl glycosylphosphotransferase